MDPIALLVYTYIVFVMGVTTGAALCRWADARLRRLREKRWAALCNCLAGRPREKCL